MRGKCGPTWNRFRLRGAARRHFHKTAPIVESTPENEAPPQLGLKSNQTYHVRKNSERSLPLSPLMDPKRIAQRKRYKLRKLAPPSIAESTEFQRKLYNNPYARALATPLRMCTITDALLPRFFLVGCDLKPNPTMDTEWHLLPSSLFVESSPLTTNNPALQSPQVYFLARSNVLRVLQGKRTASQNSVVSKAHMGPAIRDLLARGHLAKQVVCNKDIETLVSDLLRASVVRSLRWALQRPNTGYLEAVDKGIPSVEDLDDAACFLYVKSWRNPVIADLETRTEERLIQCRTIAEWTEEVSRALTQGARKRQSGLASQDPVPESVPKLNPRYFASPIPFPTVAYRGSSIPVYNLVDLLGATVANQLLAGTAFEGARYLVIKSRQETHKAQMLLLKLHAYLAGAKAPRKELTRGSR